MSSYLRQELEKNKLKWIDVPGYNSCYTNTSLGDFYIHKIEDADLDQGYHYIAGIPVRDTDKYLLFSEAEAAVVKYVEQTLLASFDVVKEAIYTPVLDKNDQTISVSVTRIFELIGNMGREVSFLLDRYKNNENTDVNNINKIEAIISEINGYPYDTLGDDIGLKLEGLFRQIFGYETLKRDIASVRQIIDQAQLWKFTDNADGYNVSADHVAAQLISLNEAEKEINKLNSLLELSKKYAQEQKARADKATKDYEVFKNAINELMEN